jgi:hypothetical protein
MSPAMTLNTHALQSKILPDGVYTEVVDVQCLCDGVALLTQTLHHQVHDDPSVVDVLRLGIVIFFTSVFRCDFGHISPSGIRKHHEVCGYSPDDIIDP